MTYNSCENSDNKAECLIKQILRPEQYNTGKVTLTSNNTPKKISSDTTSISSVKVQSSPSNNEPVALGMSTNISANSGEERGWILFPGEDIELQIDNLNMLYISGSQNDFVNYIAY